MHIFIVLTIFTYHHVNPHDSTDFCNGNCTQGIGKNVSHCNSCIGRCGDIMTETKNETCSCDVLCITHRECCGDFEQLCPEDSITAQSISRHTVGWNQHVWMLMTYHTSDDQHPPMLRWWLHVLIIVPHAILLLGMLIIFQHTVVPLWIFCMESHLLMLNVPCAMAYHSGELGL